MFTMYQSIKINDRRGFWDLKPGPSGLALPTGRLPHPPCSDSKHPAGICSENNRFTNLTSR